MTTKVKLAEQVLYRLYGGYHDTASPVQLEDVQEAINQKVNAIFKMQHFSMVLPSGETIPEGAMLATYENIPVVQYNGKSKCTLPVMPMMLTRNMGVFEVWTDDVCETIKEVAAPVIPTVPNYLLAEDGTILTTEDGQFIII